MNAAGAVFAPYAMGATQTGNGAARDTNDRNQPTANMARQRPINRAEKDEEPEVEEEEDAQQNLSSVALPYNSSDEGLNMKKDSAKLLPSQKNMLQKSDESADGKTPGSKPLQKNTPLRAKGKDAQNRAMSAEGKDAQNRQSAVKKNMVKSKSDAAQRFPNQASSRSLNLQSLQSKNRAFANLKKAPEPIVALSPMGASGPSQAAAKKQRGQKERINVAQRPKESVAAAANPKSSVAKRKAQDDPRFAQRNKKAKTGEIFQGVFDTVFNEDDLGIFDGKSKPMTIDDMIAKAEESLGNIPSELGENDEPNEKDTEELMQVASYTAKIAKAHKKSSEAQNAPSSDSPIWWKDETSARQVAFDMLHGLQTMNLRLLDILASNALYNESDDAPIIKMLTIYIIYQLEQNDKSNVNFNQDLEVMEKLIEKYGSKGSICKVFAETFRIANHPLIGGWKELERSEKSKRSGKKELDSLDESDGADGKSGARLLLLLAYMMVSNVLDDASNNTQIRPAIRVLGGKPQWKPVLRKLGQMLFLISPDPSIAEYEECYKICKNHLHFVNTYLYINKGATKNGGKKAQAQNRPISPKVETSRALQRFSVLIMNAFMVNRYQQLPLDHILADNQFCDLISDLVVTITSKGGPNILHALGYDIALRNWILESTKKLQVREKKPRAKKDGEEFREDFLQMKSQLDDLKKELRIVQKYIKALQPMQLWFSMHKCSIEDHLLYGEKNYDDDNVQHENGKERDESSENEEDENQDIDDAEGQEIEQNVGEIKENAHDAEFEEEDSLFESSDDDQKVEEPE